MIRDYFSSNEIVYLSLNKILPNPYQPRKTYTSKELEELAFSIRHYGVLQPICVRMVNKNIFELVIGERRLKASRIAGFDTIPAIIVDTEAREGAMLSMVENMQRQEFNYMEEAEGVKIMNKDFNYSLNDIAHITGKSQDYIEKVAQLVELSDKMKNLMLEMGISKENALAISQLKDEETQREVLKKVVTLDLSPKRTAEVVDSTTRRNRIVGDIENVHSIHRRKINNIRYLTNTLSEAIDTMNSTGLDTKYEIKENDKNTEINIRIKN